MNEQELFDLIVRNYSRSRDDDFKEQIMKIIMQSLGKYSRAETIDGLLNYVVLAGCNGMNDLYRPFLYAAIAHLYQDNQR